MWNRCPSRSTALRTASAAASLLLSSALLATGAAAQSLPATPALPSGGVDLTTAPDGLKLGVDGGDTGGVTLGAGPGGIDLDLRTTPKPATPPAERPARVTVPGGPAENPRSETSPGRSVPAAGDTDRSVAVTPSRPGGGDARRAAGGGRDAGGEESGRALRLGGLRPAARSERDGGGGVAPVFDLVERIPPAVRAGLVALALIALAMWGLWVRGRRRLEHNAYLDPDTDVANMAAFEQVLDREWQRAARYRRPLGLMLLELECRGPGGIRMLAARDALEAVEDINREVRASDTLARLTPSRFALICPEAPQGSVETLAHAIEHRLEERRLHCWAGFAERDAGDLRPDDLVARAAAALARAQMETSAGDAPAPGGEGGVHAVAVAGRRAAA
jgi:GGDEF domain-containing protein